MATDLYCRLTYKQYKYLEQQLQHWEDVETTHVSVDGYYHKALRLDIGDITLEIQGPAVKAPYREDEEPPRQQRYDKRHGDPLP